MNNTLKTITLTALSISLLGLNSCTEEESTPDVQEESTPKTCYITQQTETFPVAGVIAYTYDDENQVASATTDGETTTFAYEDGKLGTASSGTQVSTFTYLDGTNLLERINQQEDGADVGYILLAYENEKLTQAETHNTRDGDDITELRTNIAYNGSGEITSLVIQEYNEDKDAFETQFSLTEVQTDDKANPISSNLAYFFMNTQNPKAYGDNNIISGSAQVMGQSATYGATIEYNEQGYATAINASVTNVVGTLPAPSTFIYDCK